MKIGINSGVFYQKFDELQTIQQAAALGFDALDYTLYMNAQKNSVYRTEEYEDYAGSLRKMADGCQITFCQVHAPILAPIGEEPDEEGLWEVTRRGFRIAEILGAGFLVIHPRFSKASAAGRVTERDREYNLKMYQELLPFSKASGVKIGLENMFGFDPAEKRMVKTIFSTPEELLSFIGLLGREHAAACLDTGHANLVGISPSLFAKTLGENLGCLHVHDNWGTSDEHLAPYLGTIEWNAFMKTLKEIDFQGVFCYEPDRMFPPMPPEQLLTTAGYLLHTAENLFSLI